MKTRHQAQSNIASSIKETNAFVYEAPHRLKETLSAMAEILGDREIAVTRELTKKYEEFIRGTISKKRKHKLI